MECWEDLELTVCTISLKYRDIQSRNDFTLKAGVLVLRLREQVCLRQLWHL